MIAQALARAGQVIPGLVAASVPGWDAHAVRDETYDPPVRAVVTGTYEIVLKGGGSVAMSAAMAVTNVSRELALIGVLWVCTAARPQFTTEPGRTQLAEWTDAQVWRVTDPAVTQGDVTDRAHLTDAEFTDWLREIAHVV